MSTYLKLQYIYNRSKTHVKQFDRIAFACNSKLTQAAKRSKTNKFKDESIFVLLKCAALNSFIFCFETVFLCCESLLISKSIIASNGVLMDDWGNILSKAININVFRISDSRERELLSRDNLTKSFLLKITFVGPLGLFGCSIRSLRGENINIISRNSLIAFMTNCIA